jgi:hypothetical protein
MLARWHSVRNAHLEHKASRILHSHIKCIIDLPIRVSLTPYRKSGGYLLHDYHAVVHYGQHHEKLQRVDVHGV